jgi:hypothetical protein
MATPAAIEAFIRRWQACEGGAERANYALFLTELCTILGVAPPGPAHATSARNDYVRARVILPVTRTGAGGSTSTSAAASCWRPSRAARAWARNRSPPKARCSRPAPDGGRRAAVAAMGHIDAPRARTGRAICPRAAGRPWLAALPIVVDVGRVIELFADFSGQGITSPDRARFRIALDDLRREEVRQRLAAIWDAPHSLDPTRHAAAVTRDVATRLASISRLLEERGHEPEGVALFLMRCLFTMFAEHSGLLPAGGFVTCCPTHASGPMPSCPGSEDLWHSMDRGGEANVLRCAVRRFNGGLFHTADALPSTVRRLASCSPPPGATGAMSSPPSSARCSNRRSIRRSGGGWARITRRAPMSSGW